MRIYGIDEIVNYFGEIMARKARFESTKVISIRLPTEIYDVMKEIAEIETTKTGRIVSVMELMRNACIFLYTDNERLRDAFDRSRLSAHLWHEKKIKNKKLEVK